MGRAIIINFLDRHLSQGRLDEKSLEIITQITFFFYLTVLVDVDYSPDIQKCHRSYLDVTPLIMFLVFLNILNNV